MNTSVMIRQLCEQMNISVSKLARRLGQSPQSFGKKLKRETITLEELKAIACKNLRRYRTCLKLLFCEH